VEAAVEGAMEFKIGDCRESWSNCGSRGTALERCRVASGRTVSEDNSRGASLRWVLCSDDRTEMRSGGDEFGKL